jgi:soluble lytic murein transglycosylase-like protein
VRSPYREEIRRAAWKHGLDPLLVEAIVWQESAGRADAFRFEPAYYDRYVAGKPEWATWEPRRVASSYGLMQIMYLTALAHEWSGPPEGLFDIPTNLDIGCRILRRLLETFKFDVLKGLAAYNGGPGGVTRPLPLRYAREVRDRYARLQEIDHATA